MGLIYAGLYHEEVDTIVDALLAHADFDEILSRRLEAPVSGWFHKSSENTRRLAGKIRRTALNHQLQNRRM